MEKKNDCTGKTPDEILYIEKVDAGTRMKVYPFRVN